MESKMTPGLWAQATERKELQIPERVKAGVRARYERYLKKMPFWMCDV